MRVVETIDGVQYRACSVFDYPTQTWAPYMTNMTNEAIDMQATCSSGPIIPSPGPLDADGYFTVSMNVNQQNGYGEIVKACS